VKRLRIRAEKFSGTMLSVKVLSWLAALIVIVLLPGILLAVSGFEPFAVIYNIVSNALGSASAIASSLRKSAPIVIAAVGATVAFRCGVWNIGIQGQIIMGALGASIAGLYLDGLPRILLLPAIFVMAALFGGFWGVIGGYLRQKLHVSELICTLLLNYIAEYIVYYLVRYPLRGANAFGPTTDTLSAAARLPSLASGGIWSIVRVDIILAFVLAALIWYLIEATVLGYQVRAVGVNPPAAQLGGVRINRAVILVMFIGGAIAGLGGMSEVAGAQGYLSESVADNYGFYAIAAALIARNKPIPTSVLALIVGCFLTGAMGIQATMGVPSVLVMVILATFLLGILVQPAIEKAMRKAFIRQAAGQKHPAEEKGEAA